MTDYSELKGLAECAVGFTDISLAPDVVLGLIAEIDRLRENRTDWQARCLKRGFEYVRESDDHYVLADLPEMAALLGELLGVEVRSKENDDYGQTVSDLSDQVDAGINAFHRAYEAEKERDQLKAENEALRVTIQRIFNHVDGNIRATVRDCVNGRDDVQDIYEYCDDIEELVAAAMSKEAQP